jgi:N-acetyl-D-muramate 6-phosphate phosphatase
MARFDTVLFDLDGTLLDTADDLAAALNHALVVAGRTALPAAAIRPHVSHGARAMICFGFDIDEHHAAFASHRQQLLDYYERHLAHSTRLFGGLPELLTDLEQRGIRWGVVTNKPARYTEPLMRALNLDRHAAAIISGDSASHPKPHPAPMLLACQQIGTSPDRTLYVGDAERDIIAGRAAGMATLVALWGYLSDDDQPLTWGADGMISQPAAILQWITDSAA